MSALSLKLSRTTGPACGFTLQKTVQFPLDGIFRGTTKFQQQILIESVALKCAVMRSPAIRPSPVFRGRTAPIMKFTHVSSGGCLQPKAPALLTGLTCATLLCSKLFRTLIIPDFQGFCQGEDEARAAFVFSRFL